MWCTGTTRSPSFGGVNGRGSSRKWRGTAPLSAGSIRRAPPSPPGSGWSGPCCSLFEACAEFQPGAQKRGQRGRRRLPLVALHREGERRLADRRGASARRRSRPRAWPCDRCSDGAGGRSSCRRPGTMAGGVTDGRGANTGRFAVSCSCGCRAVRPRLPPPPRTPPGGRLVAGGRRRPRVLARRRRFDIQRQPTSRCSATCTGRVGNTW